MEWLISRLFASFQTGLVGIRQHDLLLKMIFPMLKLHFFIAEMDSGPLITIEHPVYANSNHYKLLIESFPPDFDQKTCRILSANGLELSLLLFPPF